MLISACLCGQTSGDRERHNGIEVIRCRCGVARLVTESSAQEYEHWYAGGSYHESSLRHPGCVPYEQRYEHDLKVAQQRVDRYRSILNGGWREEMRLLDVGCANGAFVDYAVQSGIDADGVDPWMQRVHPNLYRGTTADLWKRYDCITYHDVLEHVMDPLSELRRARGLMTESGTLIIDVPDVWSGAGQHHFKTEHLWYFTADALIALAARAGVGVFQIDRPIPGKMVAYGRAV